MEGNFRHNPFHKQYSGQTGNRGRAQKELVREAYDPLEGIESCADLLGTFKEPKHHYDYPLLSFGDPVLDKEFGGVRQGLITEVCGEAGAGKTNFCL